MTREEAKKELIRAFDVLDNSCHMDNRRKEAFNMAYKALSQEPCDDTVSRGVLEQVMWERDTAIEQLRKLGYELGQKIEPCDDCVSRQALLDEFKDGTEGYDWAKWTRIDIIDAIEALPPVIPKREQGEWIEQSSNKEQGEREHIWWKCSKCGQVIFSETERDRKEFHAFCGKCGAEMR